MALPWQTQEGPNEPVNTARDPEFDKMYGVEESPNDSGPQAFVKSLQSSLLRNSAGGRETQQQMIKNKLAVQLQTQLMQAKIELEKANPEYSAHPTPWGSVIMIDPRNPSNNKEVGGFAGAKDAYISKMGAEKAANDLAADPEVIGAKKKEALLQPDKTAAETEYYKNRPAVEQAQVNLANRRIDDAQRTQADKDRGPAPNRKDVEKEVYAEMQIDPNKPFMNDAGALLKASQEIENRYNKRLKDWRAGSTGAQGVAAPTASKGPAPDLSKLTNLNDDDSFD